MDRMQPDAWIFMTVVWTMVITCTVYCFWKLLTSKRRLDDDLESIAEDNAEHGRPDVT